MMGRRNLQRAAVAAVELEEVIGLEDHVVELEEGEGRLSLKPQLHALEVEHAIDGEQRPVLPEEVEIADAGQPLVVVDQQRICGSIAKLQELMEQVSGQRSAEEAAGTFSKTVLMPLTLSWMSWSESIFLL